MNLDKGNDIPLASITSSGTNNLLKLCLGFFEQRSLWRYSKLGGWSWEWEDDDFIGEGVVGR